MADMLYEICPACHGSLMVEDVDCPCASGSTPGYAPNGVTIAQVERWAERERALAGDPGLPLEKRRKIVFQLAQRVIVAREKLKAEEAGL